MDLSQRWESDLDDYKNWLEQEKAVAAAIERVKEKYWSDPDIKTIFGNPGIKQTINSLLDEAKALRPVSMSERIHGSVVANLLEVSRKLREYSERERLRDQK